MAEETTSARDVFHQTERELATLIRQYRRAFEANDRLAQDIEADAICERIRRLLYEHLELRVGMSSDQWFWLDGREHCQIDRAARQGIRATGRLICSLPEARRLEWSEPFAASISLDNVEELSDYTIWLGNRQTLIGLPRIRQQIEAGEVPSPSAPNAVNQWAFVFRRGERELQQ